MKAILELIAYFFRWLANEPSVAQKTDAAQDISIQDTTTQVVSTAVATKGAARPYMTNAMVRFLGQLRALESGKGGYNSDYANDDRWPLTTATFDQVLAWSKAQVATGGRVGKREASSAIGGYQFMSYTLESLKSSLKLSGKEIFDSTFQDDLAVALMIRRGYMRFMRGEISATAFCINLAKEWASLPVVTPMQGAHRWLKAGQSYYAGDGLNKALIDSETFYNLVQDIKKGGM